MARMSGACERLQAEVLQARQEAASARREAEERVEAAQAQVRQELEAAQVKLVALRQKQSRVAAILGPSQLGGW